MKPCKTCREVKSPDEFYAKADLIDGRENECISCRRIRNSRSHLRQTYGLSREDYDDLLAQQGGRCAICDTDTPGRGNQKFSIDHDHSCCPGKKSCGGCLRGLLCHGCNTALGLLADDPARLRAAIAYLARMT